jgi:hypothetical protein
MGTLLLHEVVLHLVGNLGLLGLTLVDQLLDHPHLLYIPHLSGLQQSLVQNQQLCPALEQELVFSLLGVHEGLGLEVVDLLLKLNNSLRNLEG